MLLLLCQLLWGNVVSPYSFTIEHPLHYPSMLRSLNNSRAGHSLKHHGARSVAERIARLKVQRAMSGLLMEELLMECPTPSS